MAPANESPRFGREVQERVGARVAPPRQLVAREHLEQRHHVFFAVEKIVIVELNRVGAELLEERELSVQALRGRQRRSALEHGRDTAERAAKAAAKRRLVAGRPQPEERLR